MANEDRIRQAVAAMKAGRKTEARDLLLALVDEDERNAKAWLYLSALVDTLEEQQNCLDNVLAIDPGNEKARKALEQVNRKLGAPPPAQPSGFADSFGGDDAFSFSAPPTAASPSAVPPAASSPLGFDSGSGFEAPAGDSFFNSPPGGAPAGGSFDWMSSGFDLSAPPTPEPPEPDPFAPATSVEWGREDGPTTYGSGKQIDLPSAQEYDDWVQGLNLANNAPPPAPQPKKFDAGAPSSSSPFIMDGPAEFGDTSFMVDSDPFGAPDLPMPETPATSSASGESVWKAEPASPFPAPEAPANRSRGMGGFASLEDSLRSTIPFDEDDADFGAEPAPVQDESRPAKAPDLAQRLGGSPARRTATPAPAASAAAPAAAVQRPSSAPAAQEDYFRYIPAEIEVDTSGARALLWLGVVVVLIVLNAASFAYMLL